MNYKGFTLVLGIILLLGMAVVGCGGEAPFVTLSNQSVSPDPDMVGKSVTISADATNNNKNTETFNIKLCIGDVVTNTTDITLNPGATQKVTFNYTPITSGIYMVWMGQSDDNLIGWSFVVAELPKYH